jgi:hypothetical protein
VSKSGLYFFPTDLIFTVRTDVNMTKISVDVVQNLTSVFGTAKLVRPRHYYKCIDLSNYGVLITKTQQLSTVESLY